MTSNWKQFRVTREMLTAAARGKSAVEGGMMLSLEYRRAFFKICFCLLYNKSSNLNISLDFVSGAIEILGKPQGTSRQILDVCQLSNEISFGR